MGIFKHKKAQHSTRHFAVCGILEIDGKILFVRHTYGTAKDRILIPGGYVKEKELPTKAVEREFFEETSVVCRAGEIYSVQFKPEEWCIVFTLDYVSGEPRSDGYENSEVLLLTVDEALARDDITNMSREILKAYIKNFPRLDKSDYIAKTSNKDNYVIFGV